MIYKRVLLKLSGESLMGTLNYGIDPQKLLSYVKEIEPIHKNGVEIAIVIGGGNIFRGLQGIEKGFDRVKGDQMGMLATVINALALQSAFQKAKIACSVLTSFCMEPVASLYSKERAVQLLKEGQIVICAGGTGNPLFTTDSAASLRAIEIQADILLKGTRVDGIYSADPEKNPNATKYQTITYRQVLDKNLRVMDLTAIVMCMENNMPLRVFNMDKSDNLKKLMNGENIGTTVNI